MIASVEYENGERARFQSAREDLPAVVRTLPQEYLKTNAVPLLQIVLELAKSFKAELDYVDKVSNVDASDLEAVSALGKELKRRRRSANRPASQRPVDGRVWPPSIWSLASVGPVSF